MKHCRGFIRFSTYILLLTAGTAAYALGGRETPAPVVTTDLGEKTYISPAASPDIQDRAEFSATINTAERLVVKGYSINVTDSSGAEVYTKTEAVAGEDPFFRRMMIAVGFARLKTPVTIPEVLSWNGTDTAGNPVPEGDYTLTVSGWDDKQGRAISPGYTITVDNTPPEVELTVPYAVFSPNGDGNQDILIIEPVSYTHLTLPTN